MMSLSKGVGLGYSNWTYEHIFFNEYCPKGRLLNSSTRRMVLSKRVRFEFPFGQYSLNFANKGKHFMGARE